MMKIPELLAPAGGMQQLKAAVENGADAVYLGGKLMNARINADNFDDETMKEAVAYAHLRNVKIYVTMNILVKDSELGQALNYAKTLYEIGVDALIVQDLGFARLLKRRIPSMRLHLSTQGTVYNLSGVREAERLGFERVVLAREVTAAEMKKITEGCTAEIEVFVHGALCICYSGQCQMSRVLGGRSGNRGMCAQPCRLEFETEEAKINGGLQRKQSHLLSPKDLCTIDKLGELCDAGISSLKIEGRMKSPEYVAIVTNVYRKYLDEYKISGTYHVSDEDRKKLLQIFNRGNFTEGYLNGNPGEELMSGELSKHQGVYIGKVVASGKRDLIEVELEDKLTIGDGVEVRNRSMPGNVVTYLRQGKGNLVTIGDIRGQVRPGDKLYKITDKALMEEARETFEGKSSSQIQGYRKIDVNAVFSARVGEYPKLTLCQGDITITKIGDTLAENAVNKPLTGENVAKQLRKTGDIPFKLANIEFELDQAISLPMSAINSLRRDAFDTLVLEKTKGRTLTREENELFYELKATGEIQNREEFTKDSLGEEDGIEIQLYFLSGKKDGEKLNENIMADICDQLKPDEFNIEKIKLCVPLYSYVEELQSDEKLIRVIKEFTTGDFDINIVPFLPNITKGEYDKYLEENFERAVSCCKKSGIFIGNLGWIHEFKEAGIRVYADYGLNIYNKETIAAVKAAGIGEFIPSHETYRNMDTDESMQSIVEFYGDIPLMVSEHLFQKNGFVDRKDAEFDFTGDGLKNKNIITQKKPIVEKSAISNTIRKKSKIIRIYFA